MPDPKPTQLIRAVRADVARATGHRYPNLEMATENMDYETLRDLQRLISNLKQEAAREKRLRRTGQFWRNP